MHADERASMARRKLGTFAMGYANLTSRRDSPHARGWTSVRRLPISL